MRDYINLERMLSKIKKEKNEMEKPFKCPYINQACGTHGLCVKCRPVITARFYPTHRDEPSKVHFQTRPEYVATSLSAMEEMLIEFKTKDLISDYTIFIE